MPSSMAPVTPSVRAGNGDDVILWMARAMRSAGLFSAGIELCPPAPVAVSSTDSEEYRRLAAAIRAHFPHAAIAPGLVLGGTDGRHYQRVARAVLRFAPVTLHKADIARIHGTDERLGIADYMRAIAFYERLIGDQAAISAPRNI
jgi:acetylornithine deacetylase/succinyl-diaminopimelate desuccinylase-like protein